MRNGKIGVAMMGPGRIVRRVMADFHNAKNCELIAMASRSPERAKAAQEEYGAKYAFSYEEMVQCPEVDLVYIATPHNFHVENAIYCMEHGKHVLCEKAFALNEKEARRMIDCAKQNGVFLMEAMWTRFFPSVRELCRLLLEEKAIGEIRHIMGSMSFTMAPEQGLDDRVFSKELAGGSLLDLGIYPLSFCSMLLGPEPDSVESVCRYAPTGVDQRFALQLSYPGGATAQLMCGMDCRNDHKFLIFGSKGMAEVPEFWRPTSFIVRDCNGKETVYHFAPETEGHHYQFVHAADLIKAGIFESPIMPLEETAQLLRLMQDIRYRHGVIYPEEA